MTSDPVRSFRTKTGTCTITDAEIVLSREGPRGAMADAVVGSSVPRLLIVYVALAGALGFQAAEAFERGALLASYALAGLGVWLLLSAARSWDCSTAPRISRSTVQRVEARRPLPPLRRGYFVVHFMEGPKRRRRLIMLPGVLSGGGDEFEHAQRVMRESGLLSSTPR
ncbi:MAG: hypothetical protein QM767_21055 [Anaeromyxobacter sp.]